MRLGLVIYGSLDRHSGGYLYDRKLVEYLRDQGDLVEIVALPAVNYAGALWQNFARSIRQRLSDLDVDILLQDELNHPSLAYLNGWLRLRAAYPMVGIVHHLRSSENHPVVLRPLYRAIERRYLATLDGYIFNSQATAQAVAALTPHGRPFVVATPGGDGLGETAGQAELIAHSQEGLQGDNTNGLEVLFVGNLIPRKGLHTLLDALRLIPDSPWHLRVAGGMELDPQYTRRCQELAGSRGLAGRVEFLGRLSDAELVRAYQESHLLVVPSRYEGFGIVYLEAMRFGAVPIGSSAGGAGEIIHPGENGWLSAPDDIAGLAVLIRTAAQERGLLPRMSLSARRRYSQFPTWTDTAEKIRQFLFNQIYKVE